MNILKYIVFPSISFFSVSDSFVIPSLASVSLTLSSTQLHFNVPRRSHVSATTTNIASENAMKTTPLNFITSQIFSNEVVVFSTTYCSHCVQTKKLFEKLNLHAKIIELDLISNGLGPREDSIAMKLYEITGQKTVPNVFINGKHLGGNDDTHAAAISGEIRRLLRK